MWSSNLRSPLRVTPRRHRARLGRGTAAAALTAALVLAAPVVVAGSRPQAHQRRGLVPPQHPNRNIPARPAFVAVCGGVRSEAVCIQATVRALNRARRLEGLGPLDLPARFGGLTAAEQMFVLTDEERTSRGLPPFIGLVPALVDRAQGAAVKGTDPAIVGPRLGTDRVLAWGGNSASGLGPLGAMYGWMYDDGYGSGNLACTAPTAPGCWGHRDNILVRWATGPVTWLVMGAAVSEGPPGGTSDTELVARVSGPQPPLSYSWAEAVAAGF